MKAYVYRCTDRCVHRSRLKHCGLHAFLLKQNFCSNTPLHHCFKNLCIPASPLSSRCSSLVASNHIFTLIIFSCIYLSYMSISLDMFIYKLYTYQFLIVICTLCSLFNIVFFFCTIVVKSIVTIVFNLSFSFGISVQNFASNVCSMN